MSKIADILDRAADLIEPEGAWSQEQFGIYNREGPCCAVGAVGRALGTRWIIDSEKWVDDHFRPLTGMSAHNLKDWNDTPGRKQEEVVAKLREAAAKAREPANA